MDFLTLKRQEIDARIAELRPNVEEARRLEQACSALEGVPRARATLGLDRGGTRRRRGGRRRMGPRQEAVLRVVRAHPDGITASGIASELGCDANPLYTPLNSLAGTAHVEKKGREWFPLA